MSDAKFFVPPAEFARSIPEATFSFPTVRFTLLTQRLLRIEINKKGIFEDRPSQVFWYRKQNLPAAKIQLTHESLSIETNVFQFSTKTLTKNWQAKNLEFRIKETGLTFHLDDPNPELFSGTTRTLDQADGQIPLQPGILSHSGWAVIDDTPSLIFNSAGWLEPRIDQKEYRDLYVLISGTDYKAALQDYQKITGTPTLLPRAFLGNWWSRFWEYSQLEIEELVERFQKEEIPLSTYIIDMDWHITKTGNSCSGWTGFSWNRELFPDPPALLDWLHQHNLVTALNLHPAEGIHPHEKQYAAAAKALGMDPKKNKSIPFDISDPKFSQIYFDEILHPLENQGVDFWWLDWQQGEFTRLPGLDPLWWLNHLHFYDLGRDHSKRPIIFSRWGGAGNHRYPIGFSGDTVISWESLAFQPYFTATAANAAYGWWSHDIGGHMQGIEDSERYVRWVQFGVLSPIFRLHSAKDIFIDRHPWGFDVEILQIVRKAMQFRHALIPYLYTMSKRNSEEGIPLITPLYYDWPLEEDAYVAPNQYLFGNQLMAAPITSPLDPETGRARHAVWFPEGEWFDFWKGEHHSGNRWEILSSVLEEIPLFARAGGIIPLQSETKKNGVANPEVIQLVVFPGKEGHFSLYEDDGTSQDYKTQGGAVTHFVSDFSQSTWRISISPVEGDRSQVPANRAYTVLFRGISRPSQITACLDGKPFDVSFIFDESNQTAVTAPVILGNSHSFIVTITPNQQGMLASEPSLESRVIRFLKGARIENVTKWKISTIIPELSENIRSLDNPQIVLTSNQKEALIELITGAGTIEIKHPFYGKKIILCNPQKLSGFKVISPGKKTVLTSEVFTPIVGEKTIVDYFGLTQKDL